MPSFSSVSCQSFPQVAGYTLTEQLYEGARTAVYRASSAGGNSVVIKLLQDAYPTFDELVHFRNQYAITKDLPISGIVRPLSLDPWQNGYALVMEDFGGISLDQYADGQPLGLIETLGIAAQIAAVLHDLYQHRVVHKDIKPANILIHPASGRVKLIDFSIASLLPRETQAIQSPKSLEGTLAYLAPEQTGRMNRAIDYRTDFYTLGVTLYQLLTGQLPFASDDPVALLHCHIAQRPMAVDQVNPAVPSMVAAVVEKLMAKNAEDRYQSAVGLAYDIDRCLVAWKECGEIAAFELGERDVSDRFTIPEKLYGRETEVRTLFEAFERVAQGDAELVLTAGFSGIGKTAVVNELYKPIVQRRGYFIRGKFDQFNRNVPLSAFVQAFQGLVRQLLSESDTELASWKARLLAVLGDRAQVLIEVIPELAQIVGPQPEVPELPGAAAQKRFDLLLRQFISVFTTADHPLVIFLDDLQWADAASLNLLKRLMMASETEYLLVMGAYRDNEVSAAHPLMLVLDELNKSSPDQSSPDHLSQDQLSQDHLSQDHLSQDHLSQDHLSQDHLSRKITTLTLLPLAEADVIRLVTDTLMCSIELATPLAQLVYQKTQGNPFFTVQFLRGLAEDGWIVFDREAGYWQCDLMQVQQLALTDDVVEFMVGRLRKLPEQTQTVLKLAACVGNQFDLETLAIVCDRSPAETSDALWQALQDGFILPMSQVYKFFQGEFFQGEVLQEEVLQGEHGGASVATGATVNATYQFLHDRIQQAAYALIPEVDRAANHYHLGTLLLQQLSTEAQEQQIFELVGQLNYGLSLMVTVAERQQLAQLNLMAGRKARMAIAYDTAKHYFSVGMELLGDDGWFSAPTLTRQLHEEAAETALLRGEIELAAVWIETILQKTPALIDQMRAYDLRLQAYQSQGKQSEALQAGWDILSQLGLRLPMPETVTLPMIEQHMQQTLADLQADSPDGNGIAGLIDLPVMEDEQARIMLKILLNLAPSAHQSAPLLFLLIACEEAKLSLRYGNTTLSAPAYADFGLAVSALLKQPEIGYQFGVMALRLSERFANKSAHCMTAFRVAAFLLWSQQPLRASADLLQESYLLARETGDSVHTTAAMSFHLFCSYFSGDVLLDELKDKTDAFKLEFSDFPNCINWSNILGQAMDRFIDGVDDSSGADDNLADDNLSVDLFGDADLLNKLEESQDQFALHLYWLNKLIVSYGFGRSAIAVEAAQQGVQYLEAGNSLFTVPIFHFYQVLSLLATSAEETSCEQLSSEKISSEETNSEETNSEQNNSTQRSADIEYGQSLLEQWAQRAPMNFLHKYQLVQAEWCRVKGERADAIDFYDRAIAGARANQFIPEEALANELAAKFYLDWGKEKVAAAYMQEAYYAYSRWGAKGKVMDLEARYAQLLVPILQSGASSTSDLFNSLMTVISPVPVSYDKSHSTTCHASTRSSLNQSLDFYSLLKASQALSSTIQRDDLLCQLTSMILQNSGGDRCALILPTDDNTWQVQAIATPEETQLCAAPLEDNPQLPVRLIQYVKNTHEMVIIDNLETNLPVIDDYLREREPKSVLCLPLLNQGQLRGILYLKNHLTSGVFTQDRILILDFLCTQAAISLENARLYQRVQQSLVDLQQAQLTIVQSEKMSALGGLVAGVAHEINNPVGCILGNVNATETYLNDLLALLDLYAQALPSPGEEIEEELEAIDLDYVREDLPKLMRAMKDSGDRIRTISKSLRIFSRADTAEKQTFNLNEGLESTVLILRHRLKPNELRPAIDVVTHYGDIPEIDCFPGQLNQVFMNILANAIDAIDDVTQSLSFAEIQANPHRIEVTTTVDDGQLKIAISDNGPGIPASVKERIFEHLFTTKAVGKGTGLGLAIVRQIIVEAHGGTIEVDSKPGEGTTFCIRLPVEVA